MWISRVHRCGEAHRLVQTGETYIQVKRTNRWRTGEANTKDALIRVFYTHRWNTQIAEECRQITHTEEAQSGDITHTIRWSQAHRQKKHCQVMHTGTWSRQTGDAYRQVKHTFRWSQVFRQKKHTVRWRTMMHTENAHMQVMHTDGWSTQTGEAWNINTGTAHTQVKLTTQASESLPGWTVSGSASSLGCRQRPQTRRRTERRRWSGGMLQMGAGSPEIKGQTLSASASSVQSQPQAH